MAASATNTFTGGPVQPSRAPEEAKQTAVILAPGSYAKGTVVAQRNSVTKTNDVQTITVTGTPTGGTFKLGFNGEVTANITYSTTDATLQTNIAAALNALTSIGASGVGVVSSSSGTSIVVTFSGTAVAGREMPIISLVTNGLTGGTNPTATVAHTTYGMGAGGTFVAYDDARSDGGGVAKGILPYAVTVDTFGRHTVGGGEWGSSALSAPMYFAGTFATADLTGIDANGVADLGKLLTGTTSLLTDAATELKIGV